MIVRPIQNERNSHSAKFCRVIILWRLYLWPVKRKINCSRKLIQQEPWFQSARTRKEEEEEEEEKKEEWERGASVSKVSIIAACNPFNWVVLCLWGTVDLKKKRRQNTESKRKWEQICWRVYKENWQSISHHSNRSIQCVFARITFSTRMCSRLVIHVHHLWHWQIFLFFPFCLLRLLLCVTSL